MSDCECDLGLDPRLANEVGELGSNPGGNNTKFGFGQEIIYLFSLFFMFKDI